MDSKDIESFFSKNDILYNRDDIDSILLTCDLKGTGEINLYDFILFIKPINHQDLFFKIEVYKVIL